MKSITAVRLSKKLHNFKKWGLGRSPKRGEGGSPTLSPFPRGRGLGIGIENKHFFEKTDFFYKLTAVMKREVHHSRCFMFLSAKLNLGKLNVDSLCGVSACCTCSVNRKLNGVAYVKLRNDILYICYGGDRCAVYL